MPVGDRYWEYVIIHVDNLLVEYMRAQTVMENIEKVYILKKDKKKIMVYGPPDVYLGTNIRHSCHQ